MTPRTSSPLARTGGGRFLVTTAFRRFAIAAATVAVTLTAQAAPVAAADYPAWYIVVVTEQTYRSQTFRSPGQVYNHDEATRWGSACQASHPGSTADGKQWNGPGTEGTKCATGGVNKKTDYGYAKQKFFVWAGGDKTYRTNKKVNSRQEGEAWVARCRTAKTNQTVRWVNERPSRSTTQTGSPCVA
ncbi:hypothetical protein AB0I60_36215 [Actinosynnema sp. NPDC050436]|uniref:hypothetical protein n=1 Tax=Actinosynnema sp. NPDC050436 TaxID=3155659 RepID=UPI0033F49EC1